MIRLRTNARRAKTRQATLGDARTLAIFNRRDADAAPRRGASILFPVHNNLLLLVNKLILVAENSRANFFQFTSRENISRTSCSSISSSSLTLDTLMSHSF